MNVEDLFHIEPQKIFLFILGFLRILSLMFFLPILGDPIIPKRLKVLIALAFSFCFIPGVLNIKNLEFFTPAGLIFLSMREIFVGFLFGIMAKLLSYSTHMASQMVGSGMGFQTGQIFNPQLQESESSFTLFHTSCVTMVILTCNFHHIFIQELFYLFKAFPLGHQGFSLSPFPLTIALKECFITVIRIGGPLILLQLAGSLILGLMSKALPQLNVFVLNYPLTFILCSVGLFLSCASFYGLLTSEGYRLLELPR